MIYHRWKRNCFYDINSIVSSSTTIINEPQFFPPLEIIPFLRNENTRIHVEVKNVVKNTIRKIARRDQKKKNWEWWLREREKRGGGGKGRKSQLAETEKGTIGRINSRKFSSETLDRVSSRATVYIYRSLESWKVSKSGKFDVRIRVMPPQVSTLWGVLTNRKQKREEGSRWWLSRGNICNVLGEDLQRSDALVTGLSLWLSFNLWKWLRSLPIDRSSKQPDFELSPSSSRRNRFCSPSARCKQFQRGNR